MVFGRRENGGGCLHTCRECMGDRWIKGKYIARVKMCLSFIYKLAVCRVGFELYRCGMHRLSDFSESTSHDSLYLSSIAHEVFHTHSW